MKRTALIGPLLITTGVLAGCADTTDTTPPASALPTRDVESGAVDVTLTPIRLDATGATFAIVLDTHTVDLGLDLAAATTLEVGGTPWQVEAWDGGNPGGHHREGELTFSATGPTDGTAVFTITGLPEVVEATWDLGGG